MGQMTDKIIIKEYDESLAKGIAKMWNLSRDSWGGDSRVHTEEQVLTKEANAGNIILYVALDGEEVVGYCSLSEYKEDIGSLYIPLLNVRPDYHSKKIGKMLLLKAVEKTIELGWPRLDLYTWPGNVKAVPLYKKCGFFWEDRDDTTHLMNFIPAVMNTPLLKPLFKKLDWYKDSVRSIEVKPDGQKENGFSFYEYEWKNERTNVRMRFERTGRGISLIETNEYFLEISLPEHEVIEEDSQTCEIKFINKSSKPVNIKVTGNHHERVKFSLNEERQVMTETVITREVVFLPGEEPSSWKTHPFLSVNFEINGEECELRLGVFPKQPAKIFAKMDGNISFLGQKAILELEVENNLKEAGQFSLQFSEHDFLELDDDLQILHLGKNERKLLSIPVTIRKHGFYQPTIKVDVKKIDGTELSYENNLVGVAIKGFGEKFGGESQDFWYVYNGISQVNIRKRDYIMTAGKNQLFNQPFAFFIPKLGKPYSTEFSKQKPTNVEWISDESSITFKMVFQSKDFNGITLILFTALFGDGIVKRWAEIENNSEKTIESLFLNQSIDHDKRKPFFPIENNCVQFSNMKYLEFGDLHSSSLTGNWYFSEDYGEPIGFCWPKSCKANFEGWQFYLEYDVGLLKPGEKQVLEPSFLSIGAFRTWQEQEAFANRQTVINSSAEMSEQCLTIAGGNLIISNDLPVPVQLNSYRTNYLHGQLKLFLNDEQKLEAGLREKEEKTVYNHKISIETKQPISIIKGEINTGSRNTQLEHLLIKTNGQIKACMEETGATSSYVLDNGIVKIKADPSFFPGLYSIAYRDNEWLDTSFPDVVAKGWWNPWTGGIKSKPSEVSAFSLLKASTTAEFKKLSDSKGNKWMSIALQTTINTHQKWKGLQYTQYFALLPGVPIIAYFVQINHSSGKSLIGETWHTEFFIRGETSEDLSVVPQENGPETQYHVGMEEQLLLMREGCFIQSKVREEKLYIVEGLDSHLLDGYMNKEAFQLVNVQKAKATIQPGFIVFDNRKLSSMILRNLQKILF